MNIIKTLKKLEEKKEIIIMNDGAVVSLEKFQTLKKKEYLNKAKAGEIDLSEVTFSAYVMDEVEKVNTVSMLLAILESDNEQETADQQAPEEPAEQEPSEQEG